MMLCALLAVRSTGARYSTSKRSDSEGLFHAVDIDCSQRRPLGSMQVCGASKAGTRLLDHKAHRSAVLF